MDKLFRKFKEMRREKLFLYFVGGIYLVYTAWSLLKALIGGADKQAPLIIFFIVFAVSGVSLVLICGYCLLRAYYLRLYLAKLEEEQALYGDSDEPRPEKEMTGAEKYLDFMYRLFKIKQ